MLETGSGAESSAGEGSMLFCFVSYINNAHLTMKRFSSMPFWSQPRFQLFVRVCLVATFLDDSLRTVTQFAGHVEEIGINGIFRFLGTTTVDPWSGEEFVTSTALMNFVAGTVLLLGFLAQWMGSIGVLTLSRHINLALNALMTWTVVQPILYLQLPNSVVITESLALLGGLFLLRVYNGGPQQDNHNNNNNTAGAKFLGRLLLVAAYLYQVRLFFASTFVYETTDDMATFVSLLVASIVNGSILLVLVFVSPFWIYSGLESRPIAFLVAVVNTVYIFTQHPFFCYTWYSRGEWHYAARMDIPTVVLPKDVTLGQLTPAQIYDLHRYFFFLGLSTSGTLLLLAQKNGPDENDDNNTSNTERNDDDDEEQEVSMMPMLSVPRDQ